MKEQKAIATELVDSKTIKIDLEDYIWLTKQGDYSHTMSMIIKKLRRELEEYRAKAKK
jgi:protein associated with RNAse G/E